MFILEVAILTAIGTTVVATLIAAFDNQTSSNPLTRDDL